MKDKSSFSNEKSNQQLLDELNRAYLHRWNNMASFALGCLTGSIATIFAWALWALLTFHHGK